MREGPKLVEIGKNKINKDTKSARYKGCLQKVDRPVWPQVVMSEKVLLAHEGDIG